MRARQRGTWRGARLRAVGALAGVGLLLAACTDAADPPPDPVVVPPPALEDGDPGAVVGLRLEVVLPTPISPGARAQLSAQVRRVPELVGPELRAAVPAAPESAQVQADLVPVLAGRAPGLLCVLGPDALALTTRELALTPAHTGFCASHVPPDEPLPERVLGIELAAEELGAALGRTAAALTDGPVGLVPGSAELPTDALVTGLRTGLGGRELELREPGADELATVLAELVDAGIEVVVLDPAVAVTDPVPDGLTVLAPAHLADRLTPAGVVALRWRVRWDLLLAEVVRARLDGDPGPVTGNLGSGGFELDAAPGVPVG